VLSVEVLKPYDLCDGLILLFVLSHLPYKILLSYKPLKYSTSIIFMHISKIKTCEEVPKIHALFLWINEPTHFL